MSNFALLLMELETSLRHGLTRKEGSLVNRPASSFTNFLRSEKGESHTMPAMLGSRSAWSSAVTAPIDLPHKAMVETRRLSRRCSTIVATSSRSNQPRDMYSPPLMPQPAKSKHNNEIFCGSRYYTFSNASSLQLEFPCI